MPQPQIVISYTINAQVAEVWQALTDPKIITKWGGGPAKMDGRVGTKFKLWGGDIWGTNIEVKPQSSLKQEWYGGDWPKPSIATFTLTKYGSGTKLKLEHSHVPTDEIKNFEQGWHDYYLGAIKKLLESGPP